MFVARQTDTHTLTHINDLELCAVNKRLSVSPNQQATVRSHTKKKYEQIMEMERREKQKNQFLIQFEWSGLRDACLWS